MFADAYPIDDYTRTNYTMHTLSFGFQFQTRRYRTGYIHNEYVVMSPFRNGITEAFIEYKFDVLVSKIEVDLSHWRSLSYEWTYPSDCTAVLRIPNGSGGYATTLLHVYHDHYCIHCNNYTTAHDHHEPYVWVDYNQHRATCGCGAMTQ